MKIATGVLRILVYLACLAILTLSVIARREVVRSSREAEAVSYIGEVGKYGKPVTVMDIESSVFEMKEKFTVVSKSDNLFEGFVTRKVASGLSEGQRISALNGHSGLYGKITYLSPTVDMMSGLYRLEVEFSEPIACKSGKLLVSARVKEKEDIIEIPNEVLYAEDGRFYAWKVSDGKAKSIEIKLTARSGYSSIVSEGLNEGDILIVTGQARLEEGDRVRIVD